MDSFKAKYRFIVEQVLRDYAEFLGNDDHVRIEQVFDRESDRYILVETGWHDGDRIYDILLHIDIIDGKLWIQRDKTEEGVSEELLDAGISQDSIVLGFKSPQHPKLKELAVS
ncbi:MAG: XisI protein [Nostocaceae cyanobacterium]|nr:XisI protein [Nostocaceae cyanobacterium]